MRRRPAVRAAGRVALGAWRWEALPPTSAALCARVPHRAAGVPGPGSQAAEGVVERMEGEVSPSLEEKDAEGGGRWSRSGEDWKGSFRGQEVGTATTDSPLLSGLGSRAAEPYPALRPLAGPHHHL